MSKIISLLRLICHQSRIPFGDIGKHGIISTSRVDPLDVCLINWLPVSNYCEPIEPIWFNSNVFTSGTIGNKYKIDWVQISSHKQFLVKLFSIILSNIKGWIQKSNVSEYCENIQPKDLILLVLMSNIWEILNHLLNR